MRNISVLEIAGRPTMAVEVVNEANAANWLGDDFVQKSLKSLQTIVGDPLWDGVEMLAMRPATAMEILKWEAGLAEGALTGVHYAGPKSNFAVKLVPIVDPHPDPEGNFI